MSKIRVAAVNYLNTKPMLYGIKRHEVMEDIELIEDYPAEVARMVLEDKADVGLIPVAVIPKMKEYHIVTDVCIGCDGEVASVGIYSELPLEQLNRIYLDYQSRTSVMLARILLRDYWKKDIELIDAKGEDFRDQIKGDSGAVIIGDRALEQNGISKHVYDLGAAWKDHTGLPFVFAAWISNKKLPEYFVKKFTEANNIGLNHLEDVINENFHVQFDLKSYYTRNIDYALNEKKMAGLEMFLKLVRELS